MHGKNYPSDLRKRGGSGYSEAAVVTEICNINMARTSCEMFGLVSNHCNTDVYDV